MNELSLFSGAGGGLLGTKLLGFRPIGYVEYEPYCQAVLAQRIKDGFLEEAPIFGDIREFVKSGAAREYRGFADVVTAGFPCQPFSVAGKQQAEADERNMWPATADVLRAVQPGFALLENVPGLLGTGYCERIFGDLAEMGFNAEWGVFSAAAEGAPHLRERLFVVANAKEEQRHVSTDYTEPDQGRPIPKFGNGNWSVVLSNDRQERVPGRFHETVSWKRGLPWGESLRRLEDLRNRPDIPKPLVRRMDDGMANYVERTGTVGNGQVPAVVVRAWTELTRERT